MKAELIRSGNSISLRICPENELEDIALHQFHQLSEADASTNGIAYHNISLIDLDEA